MEIRSLVILSGTRSYFHSESEHGLENHLPNLLCILNTVYSKYYNYVNNIITIFYYSYFISRIKITDARNTEHFFAR